MLQPLIRSVADDSRNNVLFGSCTRGEDLFDSNIAVQSLAFHHSELGAMFVADYLITGVAAKDSGKTKQQLEEIEKVVGEFEANIIKS